MYGRNPRKQIILCHGSKQNTVSFEIIILKKLYFSSWNSLKSHDFSDDCTFLWSNVVFFLAVCKAVFYFWIVRWNLFSKRFCIERFLSLSKNIIIFKSNIALQCFLFLTKNLLSGITTALKSIVIFWFLLHMPLMATIRSLKKIQKHIISIILATLKNHRSMQVVGGCPPKLKFSNFLIFLILPYSAVTKSWENCFFLHYFHLKPPNT